MADPLPSTFSKSPKYTFSGRYSIPASFKAFRYPFSCSRLTKACVPVDHSDFPVSFGDEMLHGHPGALPLSSVT